MTIISRNNKKHNLIPGFGITLGFTLFYTSIIVLIPISMLFIKTFELSWDQFCIIITDARTLSAFKLSFTTSFFAAIFNVIMGVVLAWVLVRYKFAGRRILDAFIDIPFALPTSVAGIALTALYAPTGMIGEILSQFDVKVAYTPIGIWLALVFVSIPFVVRTVEPVLRNIDRNVEEAALCLGAERRQIFFRIILPQLFPSILIGFSMSFARSLGEYGSVIFIAGNMPYISEITPLLIAIKLEQYQYAEATAIALIMLMISMIILFAINYIQCWNYKKDRF